MSPQSNALQQLIDQDRAAVLATVGLACRIEPADLIRPTPCPDWTLAELLAHLTGQQLGFAAAARGEGADLRVWQPVTAPDPVLGYLASCVEVVQAFADPTVGERDFALPELRAGRGFPAGQAVSFHLIDNVVHAWDLAATLGLALEMRDDLLRAGLRVAQQVPDGPERTEPGAAFAPGRPVPDGAGPLEQLLLLLGRSPSWPD